MATSQEHLQPPETGRDQEKIFHQDFQKESGLQDSFQTSDLPNWKRTNSCCFKPLYFCNLLQKQVETNTPCICLSLWFYSTLSFLTVEEPWLAQGAQEVLKRTKSPDFSPMKSCHTQPTLFPGEGRSEIFLVTLGARNKPGYGVGVYCWAVALNLFSRVRPLKKLMEAMESTGHTQFRIPREGFMGLRLRTPALQRKSI